MIKELLFVAAAHSGGHITPAAALAAQWQQAHPQGQIIFFTSNRPLDQKLCASHPWLDRVIALSADHSTLIQPLSFVVTAWRLVVSFFVSLYYAIKLRPTEMLTTGGMIGVPVSYAAWLVGARVTLYELNATPGRASRLIVPLATDIAICFESAQSHFGFFAPKCHTVPYPLRYQPEQRQRPASFTYKDVCTQPGVVCTQPFQPQRRTLLILGGSQGSAELNELIPNIFEHNQQLAAQVNIIHQTGGTDLAEIAARYTALGIPACLFAYLPDIYQCYWLADVVLCRAGAGAIFEALFFGTPTLLLPLATGAGGHQVANARAIAAQYPEQFAVSSPATLESDLVTRLAHKHHA